VRRPADAAARSTWRAARGEQHGPDDPLLSCAAPPALPSVPAQPPVGLEVGGKVG
jgi:hypothetical protein